MDGSSLLFSSINKFKLSEKHFSANNGHSRRIPLGFYLQVDLLFTATRGSRLGPPDFIIDCIKWPLDGAPGGIGSFTSPRPLSGSATFSSITVSRAYRFANTISWIIVSIHYHTILDQIIEKKKEVSGYLMRNHNWHKNIILSDPNWRRVVIYALSK